jgi:hypothetical protein
MKRKNVVKVKVDHVKLARQISRKLFGDIPMKEKVIKDKTRYTRKEKFKKPPEI